MTRPRVVGINHVALEFDEIDPALDFYGRLFELEIGERLASAAFIGIGDQFIALIKGARSRATPAPFGLVVDDKEATRRALQAEGAEILPGRFLDFLDPSGNRVQVMQCEQIQFAKTDGVR
jgi:lactoylglutathione lyase